MKWGTHCSAAQRERDVTHFASINQKEGKLHHFKAFCGMGMLSMDPGVSYACGGCLGFGYYLAMLEQVKSTKKTDAISENDSADWLIQQN